jgi:hypothetical protein
MLRIRIHDEEGLGEEWQAGFYCFDADIMRVEDAIQASTARLSGVNGVVTPPDQPLFRVYRL